MSELVYVFKVHHRAEKDTVKFELLEEKSFRSLLKLLAKRFEIFQGGIGNEDEVFWSFDLDGAEYDITSPEIRAPFRDEEMPFEEGQVYELNSDLSGNTDDPILEITLVETKDREEDRKYPRIINIRKNLKG